MNAHVAIGSSHDLRLRKAILIYEGGYYGAGVFATIHNVLTADTRAPRLAAGELVTMSFLQRLAQGLGENMKPEVLPPNVLCRTPHLISWWTEAVTRPLFFRKGSELGKVSGKHFPLPPLVWRISGREIHIRALSESVRPGPDTPLFKAPFWNTNAEGLVCQGSMQKPDKLNATVLRDWEDGYFAAEFTHVFDQFGAKDATKHKGGIIGLWKSLAGERTQLGRTFPVKTLVPAKQTLSAFIEGASNA